MSEIEGRLAELGHELPVIFLTAHGTIERAVEAVRLGAFDFIEKPPHVEKILLRSGVGGDLREVRPTSARLTTGSDVLGLVARHDRDVLDLHEKEMEVRWTAESVRRPGEPAARWLRRWG